MRVTANDVTADDVTMMMNEIKMDRMDAWKHL